MLQQCPTCCKSFTTDTALIRFLPCMDPSVHCDIESLAETFATDITSVRLVSFVCLLMGSTVDPSGKKFSTDATWVRFFTRMNPHMLLQAVQARECLLANSAAVWLFSSMSAYVNFQGCACPCCFSTYVTFIWFLPCVFSAVRTYTIWKPKRHAANVTLVRLLSRVGHFMSYQITMLRKFFPTVLADIRTFNVWRSQPHSIMSLSVPPQVTMSVKAFITYFTHMSPLSTVPFLMLIHCRPLVESFPTLRALKGSLTCMDPHMISQRVS